jgi:hypothetical protein
MRRRRLPSRCNKGIVSQSRAPPDWTLESSEVMYGCWAGRARMVRRRTGGSAHRRSRRPSSVSRARSDARRTREAGDSTGAHTTRPCAARSAPARARPIPCVSRAGSPLSRASAPGQRVWRSALWVSVPSSGSSPSSVALTIGPIPWTLCSKSSDPLAPRSWTRHSRPATSRQSGAPPHPGRPSPHRSPRTRAHS